MYDMTRFGASDITDCAAALRDLGAGARSMEAVARRICRHLYLNLVDVKVGTRCCALVRFYKTHSFGELPPDLQASARSAMGSVSASPDVKCLTLLGTAGDSADWNDRRKSKQHAAIPLASEAMVRRIPMISRMIQQFGIDIGAVIRPDPSLLTQLENTAYQVFHVAHAAGSPYVPAQESFVVPYGIQSVLGFGGMLPTGNLFAVIAFTRVPIQRVTANLFQTLALSVKVALLPFPDRVFD